MARRRKREEHVNHEAWAIPYGDLITLLLAFFVVMYAISSVNEGKYRVLSDSLVAAFRTAPKSLQPVQTGELARAFDMPSVDMPRTLVPLEADLVPELLRLREHDRLPEEIIRQSGASEADMQRARDAIAKLATRIRERMAPLVDAELIRVRENPLWIEVEINTEVLFASGSASMTAPARDIIKGLGEVLVDGDVEIRVEGHTDTLPIRTEVFPSNWELSSARAASVVHVFMHNGVPPETMAAIGYGEYRPVADNDTPEGRAENRRVVIVVMAGSPPRALAEPVHAGKMGGDNTGEPIAVDPVDPRERAVASSGKPERDGER